MRVRGKDGPTKNAYAGKDGPTLVGHQIGMADLRTRSWWVDPYAVLPDLHGTLCHTCVRPRAGAGPKHRGQRRPFRHTWCVRVWPACPAFGVQYHCTAGLLSAW